MAYVHIKKFKNKKYYSLRESKRIGNKIVSKYLGSIGENLSRLTLNKLQTNGKSVINPSKNINKKIISEIYFKKAEKIETNENKYFNRNQLVQINSILMHFRKEFKGLSKNQKDKILNRFNLLFVTENVFMDGGNHLSTKDILKIFVNEICPNKISLKEVYMITNIKKALEFLKDKKPQLTLKNIERIDELIFDNLPRLKEYRNYKINVNGCVFNPLTKKEMRNNLNEIIKWYHKNQNKINPLALAILFHHKFEKIHPFFQGNGEIGKILMNYILFLNDYPPLIIPNKLKKEYFDCLKKADKSVKKDILDIDMKYYKPLIDFMQKQFVKTYWNNFL